MTQQNARKWRERCNHLIRESDLNKMLDVLLALDRMVVEHSMRVYNIPRLKRSIMREHNRHLHAAVRKHLPRLMEPSRGHS
jgi:hypothetical protein